MCGRMSLVLTPNVTSLEATQWPKWRPERRWGIMVQMNKFVSWALIVVMLFAAVLIWLSAFTQPSANAANKGCEITYAVKNGNTITIKVCNQIFSLDINKAANGSLGSVDIPPITIPGPTITLPPIPGPTKTVTKPAKPAKTKTVTAPAKPAKTVRVTVTQPPPPAKTVTATRIIREPAAVVTRQVIIKRDTIEPAPKTVSPPAVRLGDGEVTFVETTLTLAALLGLMSLGLLAMYVGYILGYKDKERKDTNFMRAVLEAAAIKRR